MKENKTRTIRLNNPEGMKMTFEEKKEATPLQEKIVLQEKPSPEHPSPTQEAKKVEVASEGVSKEDFQYIKGECCYAKCVYWRILARADEEKGARATCCRPIATGKSLCPHRHKEK